MSGYAAAIHPLAEGRDPRHIEAYMRSKHGTLDALAPAEFLWEVRDAIECVDKGGAEAAEALAQSYGL